MKKPPPEEPEKDREAHLRLRQIEVFLAAARRGNFSAAASELGISSAALSKAIADLERNLGQATPVSLFDRDQNGARLTPIGRAFVAHGEALLSAEVAARTAITKIQAQATSEPVRLKIAYEPEYAGVLMETVNQFSRVQPIVVYAEAADSKAITRSVQQGEIDVGIVYYDKARRGHLQTEVDVIDLRGAWLTLIVNPQDKLVDAERVEVQKLEHLPLAFPWAESDVSVNKTRIQRTVESYLAEHGVVPKNVVLRGDLRAVLHLVQTGAAATVHTGSVAVGSNVRALQLEPARQHDAVAVLRRKAHPPLEEITTRFADELLRRLHRFTVWIRS